MSRSSRPVAHAHPFDQQARKVLELTFREAVWMGSGWTAPASQPYLESPSTVAQLIRSAVTGG